MLFIFKRLYSRSSVNANSNLIYIQHDGIDLSLNNLSVLSAISQISNQENVTGLLACHEKNDKLIEEASKLPISKLLVSINPLYKYHNNCAITKLLLQAGNYDNYWTLHNSIGKDIFPRLVGSMTNALMISDIVKILENNKFQRLIYAGNVISTVKVPSFHPDNDHSKAIVKKVITVRATAFQPVKMENNRPAAPIEEIKNVKINENDVKIKVLGEETGKSDRPDLSVAKIIVSGGRALRDAKTFSDLLNPLADALLHASASSGNAGVAIGASRAAVDAGYIPNEYQIGQTGRVVAPSLYIAIGISGAIQHVAGMKDSSTIVAINKDKEAPIFNIADYGMVGDLYQILPELTEKLKKSSRTISPSP